MSTVPPTNPLLHAAKVVGRGFLLGLGFSVALGAAAVIGQEWSSHRSAEQVEALEAAQTDKHAERDIALTGVEEVTHDRTTVIIGTATNHGKTGARGIDIQVNLFNHGKFVDQYSTYLKGAIEPGKSQYFKISCGCKDTPPAEHDSYKLEVLGGY
jgi:hypothetical protein